MRSRVVVQCGVRDGCRDPSRPHPPSPPPPLNSISAASRTAHPSRGAVPNCTRQRRRRPTPRSEFCRPDRRWADDPSVDLVFSFPDASSSWKNRTQSEIVAEREPNGTNQASAKNSNHSIERTVFRECSCFVATSLGGAFLFSNCGRRHQVGFKQEEAKTKVKTKLPEIRSFHTCFYEHSIDGSRR